MLVKELMKAREKEIVTATPKTEIIDAMELLLKNKISCLPVVDGTNKLQGIISDKDIFRAVYEHQTDFTEVKLTDIMTSDVIVGVEDDDMEYIAGIMTNNRIRHVPIVDGDHLVYLISIGDVVKVRQKDIEIENRYLKQYIDGTYPA